MGAALYMPPPGSPSSRPSTRPIAAHNWPTPFGAGVGTFGPYYTLATSAGLGWLGTLLIIDAIISPGGTGLVYLSAASRLSYSLAKTRFLPPVFPPSTGAACRGSASSSAASSAASCSCRSAAGPSWSGPSPRPPRSCTASRRSRRSRCAGATRTASARTGSPILTIIAPFSFIVSGLIIYWSGTVNVIKLDLAVIFFLVLYFIARGFDPNQAPMDFQAGSLACPWIVGLTIFSVFGGSYVGGYSNHATTVHRHPDPHHLPFWWDIGAIAVFSPDRLLLRRAQPPQPRADRCQCARGRRRRPPGGPRPGHRRTSLITAPRVAG